MCIACLFTCKHQDLPPDVSQNTKQETFWKGACVGWAESWVSFMYKTEPINLRGSSHLPSGCWIKSLHFFQHAQFL